MSAATFSLPANCQVLFRDLGVPLPRLLRRAGLPLDWFRKAGSRVAIQEFYRMWEGLEAEVGAHQLPRLLAETISVEAFDPANFASICSPDLNHALVRLAHFKPLIGPLRLEVDRTPHHTRLTVHWPVLHPPPLSFAQAELLWWVGLARLTTRTRIKPLAMTAPCPADFSDFAGVPIEAGPTWSITFSALDAARPFLTANESMWNFFEPDLRRRLDALTEHATTRERVRAALLELLPAGDVAMTTVARQLCTSKRTLQRRLSAEDTTYQAILNETREALARHYLESSVLPAAEISFLLGYADPNSFYRAFHAWTGTTPETLRTRAAG